MFKSVTCAALTTISICTFAQTTGNMMPTESNELIRSGIYRSDAELAAYPPTNQKNVSDFTTERRNVMIQARMLSGGDRYQFSNMIQDAPGNVANSLIQALYNARCEANVVRYDMIVQAVAAEDLLAMSPTPGYTYYFAQTPTTLSAQTTTTDFTDVSNRPMRMVLNQTTPVDINYQDAIDIIDNELSTGAKSEVNEWFWNTASDQDRDVIVRLLKKDAWSKCVPIYASTLTHRTI